MVDITLLIIDDDINIVSTMGKMFTTMTQGFLVLTATSANEGYAMIKERRPAIVVLDIRLGPKSGMDLLQDFDAYFKEPSNRKYKPRFIVITAYPDERIEKEAREVYKVDAFLLKPVKDTDIRKAIAASLEKVLEPYNVFINTYRKNGESEKELQEKERRKVRDAKIDEDIKWLEGRKQ